ncbi:MAG: radical SAM protein [Proteobacteria bacterium]|nr:radical SAM protein [Pseudomonadota bacterium]
MLLIHPPLAKACEPPAGIARLAGALRGHNLSCTLLDANLEGLLFLLHSKVEATDKWSARAGKNVNSNIDALRSDRLYQNQSRYERALTDANKVLQLVSRLRSVDISFANYQDSTLSPLKSDDLILSATMAQTNIFYPYFSKRIESIVEEKNPTAIGFSLNYLSQALTTFAMIGFIKKRYPRLTVVLGGGLVTSWLRKVYWQNPFFGLVDHLVAGPGEDFLLTLLGVSRSKGYQGHDFDDLPLDQYFSPGLILPYATATGCYWKKCSFCPETSEGSPYIPLLPEVVVHEISTLKNRMGPVLLHLLDDAISPALLKKLAAHPPGLKWYGFARVSALLMDLDFCRQLKASGCVLLKLGLESGDQAVLDAMNKGIDLAMASRVLETLKRAGIATYVYLLFGTPWETYTEAGRTLDFVIKRHETVTFLNLAIFNLPVSSPEAASLEVKNFYAGDLSLYKDFVHPRGWQRKDVRNFLEREFKVQPEIKRILRRDPPYFTSNHAPFFSGNA